MIGNAYSMALLALCLCAMLPSTSFALRAGDDGADDPSVLEAQ